jgi:tRNA U34 2-thiouridine synthase MnmA/TrmU
VKKKVYLLFSGGLDSIIAAKLLKNLGFEVIAVNIVSPFFERDRETVKKIAEKLGIDVIFIEAGNDYLEMLKNPKYGYGKNINPCIDCKAYMLRKVAEIADNNIIATGDVLGQRPMSQRKEAFKLIEKLANLEGKVLRPLSGKLLPPTIYEKEGLIKREQLLDLKGRTRKKHEEILKKLNLDISEYPTPAGGCLLTDPNFSKKVKDLIKHNELNRDNVKLLKVGRHFRINSCKFVLGRNKEENEKLKELVKQSDFTLKPISIPGPTGILRCSKEPSSKILDLCAGILARYCSKRKGPVEVSISKGKSTLRTVKAEPVENTKEFLITSH